MNELDARSGSVTEHYGATSRPGGEASSSPSSSNGDGASPGVETIVRVIQCEIVKPLDSSWDALGLLLHGLVDQAWRATNAAIDAHRNNGDAWRAMGGKVQSVSETQREVLDNLRKWYGSRKDGSDREKMRNAFRATLFPSSAVLDACQSRAAALVGKWRKGAPKGEMSMPCMRRGRAVPIRDGKWRVRRDEAGYVLECNLLSAPDGKKRIPWVSMAVVACGGSAHAMMRRLIAGEIQPCDARVSYDENKRKWYAYLVTKGPRPETLEASLDRVLAVHWGVREALTFATTDARGGPVKGADGEQLLAFKHQQSARRASLRAHEAALGFGAIGHGKRRRERALNKALDADKRFTRSWCERSAAAVIQLAVKHGCGVVLVEDYSPRELADSTQNEHVARLLRMLPNAQLREAIRNACVGAGLVCRETSSSYESVTCPICRHVDAAQDDGRGTFTCAGECAHYKRSTDLVAALNMLARDGAEDVGKKQATRVREVSKAWRESAKEKERA